MKPEDKAKFLEQMNGCAVVYRHVVDGHLLDVFWKMLIEYEIEPICQAFEKHLRLSKFFPTPAEIISYLPNAPQHITADEAWAIAAKSFDEFETVVWTQEMAEARAIVSELYDAGDHIGARMGFRSAYERIVKNAGAPKWVICTGYDKQLRIDAVSESIRLGRLPPKAINQFLLDAPVKDAGPIAGLLTGTVVQMPGNDENLKSRWHELRMALDDGLRKAEENKRREIEAREQQRLDFEKKRADVLELVKQQLTEIA